MLFYISLFFDVKLIANKRGAPEAPPIHYPINFISKKPSKYIEKHIKNVNICKNIQNMGGEVYWLHLGAIWIPGRSSGETQGLEKCPWGPPRCLNTGNVSRGNFRSTLNVPHILSMEGFLHHLAGWCTQPQGAKIHTQAMSSEFIWYNFYTEFHRPLPKMKGSQNWFLVGVC